jgi:hypothetical protein
VTVLGVQPSRCISSNSCKAVSQRPAFSHALIKLLYVITLQQQATRTVIQQSVLVCQA